MVMMLSCTLLAVTLALEVTVLVSEKTPFSVQDVLSRLPPFPSLSLTIATVPTLQLDLFHGRAPDIVLDYSYSPAALTPLRPDLNDVLVVGMYPSPPLFEVSGLVGCKELAQEAAVLMTGLNITKSFLASSESRYKQCAGALYEKVPGVFEEVASLPDGLGKVDVERFVGRVLKPVGRVAAVLLVDQSTGALLLPALHKYHLYEQGFVYVVTDETAWGQREDGLLYFTDAAAVNATDRLSYEAFLLKDRLEQLTVCFSPLSRHFFPCIRPSIVLVNIANGRPRQVESLNSIVFPGNKTTVPSIVKPIISVWADLEGRDSDGSVYPSWQPMNRGTILAYNEANSRYDLVPSYQFLNRSVSFGAMKFNKTWAVSQIEEARKHSAIAYHSFFLTATVLRLYQTFQEVNLTMPITSFSTSPALSDPVRFPLFLRTYSSSATSITVMVGFFRVFGWKRVAIIHSNSQGDSTFYQIFHNTAQQHHIEIVNNETKHQVPLDLANAQRELNETLQDFLNSTVRILILVHPWHYLIAARLYDLGARAGDYLVCLNVGLAYSNYGGSDDISRKARQVMRGAMSFGDHYFGGKEGPRLEVLLQTMDGVYSDRLACVNYDSAMLVAHATHYMLYKGLHFEQGLELIKVMRSTRFQGCMGVVQIESGSNDIRPGEFSVTNVHLVGDNETLEIVEAAIYSPTRIQMYTFLPELQFPDNSSSFPDSWETDVHCPYLSRYIQDFPTGQYLAIGLNFGFVAIISLITFIYMWRKQRAKLEVMQSKQPMSFYDGFALYQVCVEFLQLLALAPKLYLPASLANAQSVFSFNIWEIAYFNPGVFSGIEISTFVLLLIYLVLFGIRYWAHGSLRRNAICKLLRSWAKRIVQPISSLLFFPIASVLLSTFVCDRATGPGFSDSFLAADCWERCWQGKHLRLLIVSAGLLCLYTPVAILTRPYWQDLHRSLHIKASPTASVGKALLQLLLIASFVSLKANYPTLHASLFVAATAIYSLLLAFLKPYNYERLNLWERELLVAACLYGVLGLIKVQIPSISVLWLHTTLASSYSFLCITGLVLQCIVHKYQSLLVREKEDRYDIIKFAFTFGVSAQRHLRDFQTKRRNNRLQVELSEAEPTMLTPQRVPRIRIINEEGENVEIDA